MSDIVERLRATCETGCDPDLIYEAAGEIEALRVENAELREILDIAVDDHDSSMGRSNVPAHWTNRARALTQTKGKRHDA